MTRKPQIWIDLDGVTADFDAGFERLFGCKISEWHRPPISTDPEVWDRIHESQSFWIDLPLMGDALELWNFVLPYDPIVLTATPNNKHHDTVASQKILWCKRNLNTARVVCSRSGRKHKYAVQDDVLIDDRPHQAPAWRGAGGIWITHTSAADSIAQLKALGYR